MNYPLGSNTPRAPWNLVDPDEPAHPHHCDNCRRFIRRYGWDLVEVAPDATLWEVECRHCGERARHVKEY